MTPVLFPPIAPRRLDVARVQLLGDPFQRRDACRLNLGDHRHDVVRPLPRPLLVHR